jgi:hypothetical protein
MPAGDPVVGETWLERSTGEVYTIRDGSTRYHLVIGNVGEPETDQVRREWFLDRFLLLPQVNELWVENSSGRFYAILDVTVRADVTVRRVMVGARAIGEPSRHFQIELESFLQQHTFVDPPPVTDGPYEPAELMPISIDLVRDGGILNGVRADNIQVGIDMARAGAADLTMVMLREAVRRDSNVTGINPTTVNHALFAALVQASEGYTYQEFMQALSPAYQEAYRSYLQFVVEGLAAGQVPLVPPENPSFWDRLERDNNA